MHASVPFMLSALTIVMEENNIGKNLLMREVARGKESLDSM